jgi:hypothetical protein
MCDYSLDLVASRPAKVGETLVSTRFPSYTRGFASASEPSVAVCLRPGTELSFEQDVQSYATGMFRSRRDHGQRLARFRQIDMDRPHVHHDALELADGQIVLLTALIEGQHAKVLQLPSDPNADAKTVREGAEAA